MKTYKVVIVFAKYKNLVPWKFFPDHDRCKWTTLTYYCSEVQRIAIFYIFTRGHTNAPMAAPQFCCRLTIHITNELPHMMEWLGHITQTFVKTGLKSPENGRFRRICKFPLLSSLFSESPLAARVDNHPNTFARKHGKRELKGKGGAAF